jgi:DNA primase
LGPIHLLLLLTPGFAGGAAHGQGDPAALRRQVRPFEPEGKIFIDDLRNGHAQTTAAAFSARSRPGMGVSMPVAREDLPGLNSGSQWIIATAREHMSFEKVDPWAGHWKSRQTLTRPMKNL